MYHKDHGQVGASSDPASVTVMLGMLESILTEASDDDIMSEFSETVGFAIEQLRGLQLIAYETMIEIETERALGRPPLRIGPKLKH